MTHGILLITYALIHLTLGLFGINTLTKVTAYRRIMDERGETIVNRIPID